ncbi:SCO6745 family protein [Rhodococcus daqingensis]|uniref:SalK n=1 Tax=Rhodococcus daqingensis TaxID=2479363 RepID=A0ABW2S0D2_9NOCA
MDARTAGQAARTLDLIHGMSYFAPEVNESLVAAGLSPGRMCYFAGRSAAMGAVGAGVVAATFYNFNPAAISPVIPVAWTQARPEEVVAARYRGVDAAMRRIFGAEAIAAPAFDEAAALAATAARAIPDAAGRPLYAGHAGTAWPSEPHLVLWHSLTLLREYRGDGHIAALQTAGLSGLEALVTHTATGTGFQEQFAKSRRGWSDEQWNEAVDSLTERGLLDAGGELTPAGWELRECVEDLTNEMAVAPWASLGEEAAARLLELGTGLRAVLVAQEVFPDGVYGSAVPR